MIMLVFATGGSPCIINTRCPKVPTTSIAREIAPSFGGRAELKRELDVKQSQKG